MTSKTATQSGPTHDDRALASLSYMWILCVIPLAIKKDSEFVQHHARQGLVLFVFELLVLLFGMLPFLGWFIITPVGTLAAIIFAVLGVSQALQGNEWEMPFLGPYASKFKKQ